MDLEWIGEALEKRGDCCTHPYQATDPGSGSGSPTGAEPENKHRLAGGPCPSPVGPESCPRAPGPCTSGYQPGEKGVEDQESSPWQPSPPHWSMQYPPTTDSAMSQTLQALLHYCYSNGHICSSSSNTIILGLILIQSTYLHDGSWAVGSSRGPGGGLGEAR